MQARGIFLTVLSAVLYGLNPLFSKTINVGGCNSLTQTFARLAAGIVIFFILLVCSGSGSVREKLRLSRQELKDILICCIGYGLIGPLLFASYNYLASGLATTLHFVYPVLVVVACIAFRYERANRRKLVCCALCFAGILCFYTPGGDVSAYGVFLALASGVAWAYYIVHLNSSGLVTMAPFKLAFWLRLFRRARRRHHARNGRIRLALHRLHARRTRALLLRVHRGVAAVPARQPLHRRAERVHALDL